MELIDFIKGTAIRLDDIIAKFEDNMSKFEKLPSNKKIVLVGSGSSYNSAYIASKILDVSDKVSIYYPNTLIDDENFLKDKLVIFISQEGRTKKIYEYIQKYKNITDFVTFTYSNDSIIAKVSKYPFEINCGDEAFVYRTCGVTTSIVSIIMLLAAYFNLPCKNSICKDLIFLRSKFDNLISYASEKYKDFDNYIVNKKMLFVAADDKLESIAKEISIKFCEMLPIYSSSYELEELIHGPQNSFDKDSLILLFNSSLDNYEKFIGIKNFISKEIGEKNVYSVSSNGEAELALDNSDYLLKPLEYLVVFQVFAYYSALKRNRNLSKKIYENLTKYVNKQL